MRALYPQNDRPNRAVGNRKGGGWLFRLFMAWFALGHPKVG